MRLRRVKGGRMLTAPPPSRREASSADPCGCGIGLPIALSHFQRPVLGKEAIEEGEEHPLHVGLFLQGQSQTNGLGELSLLVLWRISAAFLILNLMTGQLPV
jgi:hypothetical protein